MKIEDKIMDIFDFEADAVNTGANITIESPVEYSVLESIMFKNEYLHKNLQKVSPTRFSFMFKWYDRAWSFYYIEVKKQSNKVVITITKLITPVATDGGVLYV